MVSDTCMNLSETLFQRKEILDLGVFMMKRSGIDITEQKKIIKEKTEDLQVDLVA